MLDAIAESLRLLGVRTIHRFKRAHVLQQSDGLLINLDFGCSAWNEGELIELMREAARRLGPDDILPAADPALWARFVAVDSERRRLFSIPGVPGTRYGKIPAVVRIEHAD
jgi:hypothetical protein